MDPCWLTIMFLMMTWLQRCMCLEITTRSPHHIEQARHGLQFLKKHRCGVTWLLYGCSGVERPWERPRAMRTCLHLITQSHMYVDFTALTYLPNAHSVHKAHERIRHGDAHCWSHEHHHFLQQFQLPCPLVPVLMLLRS